MCVHSLLTSYSRPNSKCQLVYLVIVVSLGKSPFPLIAIIMIAAGYGLQARLIYCCVAPLVNILTQILIFILKREFMLIGWMVVYLLS